MVGQGGVGEEWGWRERGQARMGQGWRIRRGATRGHRMGRGMVRRGRVDAVDSTGNEVSVSVDTIARVKSDACA